MVLYLIRGLIDIMRGSGVSETMIARVRSLWKLDTISGEGLMGSGRGGELVVDVDVVACRWVVFDELSRWSLVEQSRALELPRSELQNPCRLT